MKVLAIEDQPVAALLIKSTLESLGHDAELAPDCATALKLLETGAHRIVVSDWRMPVMNGLEFCRELRKRGGDYVYFILVSSTRVTKASRDEAYAAGVDDFLSKPVDADELGQRIRVAERILDLGAQVKQLEAFLPICGYCKKIRTDGKFWEDVEAYFSRRRGERFSHGVCPECFEVKIAPQLRSMGVDPAKVKSSLQ